MQPSPLNYEARMRLLKHLEGGKSFQNLADSFIQEAVEGHGQGDQQFQSYYRAALEAITYENSKEIAELAQSPIEKIFLHSLLLTFIKNDGLGLLVQRTEKDTPAEVADTRMLIGRWREFIQWFNTNKPADSIEEFLDMEVANGVIDPGEREGYIVFLFRYTYISMDGSYHMTLQPRFPNIKIEGKSIRPDMYFWIPNQPEVNIIVECDGFHYHSDKEKFKTDRQRDRALKALGYDVLRFSGSEIMRDPINAPYELARYLWDRAKHGRSAE